MNAPALALDTIQVDVAFYDAAEKAKLMAYPTASVMEELVTKPLEIPKAEFLTYYLFHRIKLGTEDYRNYSSVAKKVHRWLGAIGECIDYENGSVRTPSGVTRQLNEVSEHVGEAIGLSVVNRIHGLTEADWAPIPEERGRGARPSFDFQIASDGIQFVQVEAKGSSVTDNRALSKTVKVQKRKIDKKKAKLAALAEKNEESNPASLRYGTITVIDARQDGNVRCLLTDPPFDQMDEDPVRFRLLSRMSRLRDWICFLSPRSNLATALATRVAALEALNNPFKLNDVPLLRGTGEPFCIQPYEIRTGCHSFFMASKSRVTDGPAGGVVVQLSERELFFVGIREELLVIAANQQFEELIQYKAPVASMSKTIDCTFSAGRYSRLVLPPSIRNSSRIIGGYAHFSLSGKLNYSPEGLVFGILPLPGK